MEDKAAGQKVQQEQQGPPGGQVLKSVTGSPRTVLTVMGQGFGCAFNKLSKFLAAENFDGISLSNLSEPAMFYPDYDTVAEAKGQQEEEDWSGRSDTRTITTTL